MTSCAALMARPAPPRSSAAERRYRRQPRMHGSRASFRRRKVKRSSTIIQGEIDTDELIDELKARHGAR